MMMAAQNRAAFFMLGWTRGSREVRGFQRCLSDAFRVSDAKAHSRRSTLGGAARSPDGPPYC
jgi:hypothetical protein